MGSPGDIVENHVRFMNCCGGDDNDVKRQEEVLLVGDGGAGKTSLVKQLLGEEFDKDESIKSSLQPTHVNYREYSAEEIFKN